MIMDELMARSLTRTLSLTPSGASHYGVYTLRPRVSHTLEHYNRRAILPYTHLNLALAQARIADQVRQAVVVLSAPQHVSNKQSLVVVIDV